MVNDVIVCCVICMNVMLCILFSVFDVKCIIVYVNSSSIGYVMGWLVVWLKLLMMFLSSSGIDMVVVFVSISSMIVVSMCVW